MNSFVKNSSASPLLSSNTELEDLFANVDEDKDPEHTFSANAEDITSDINERLSKILAPNIETQDGSKKEPPTKSKLNSISSVVPIQENDLFIRTIPGSAIEDENTPLFGNSNSGSCSLLRSWCRRFLLCYDGR
jgi:hypothetical protein